MKFDLLTGGQEIKLVINYSCEILTFLAVILSYFVAFITFGDAVFQFHNNKLSLKQAPGHNHENTIDISAKIASL